MVLLLYLIVLFLPAKSVNGHNEASGLTNNTKESSALESHPSQLAVDGDLSTDFHSQPSNDPKWWKIFFDELIYVIRVVIHNAQYKGRVFTIQ